MGPEEFQSGRTRSPHSGQGEERSEIILEELKLPVLTDSDIIVVRQEGRALAAKSGFASTDLTLVATAISELARNIVTYAGRGEIILRLVRNSERNGVVVIARDEGPGIPDVHRAMRDGYSTSRGLGLGLPGVRRLMDELFIDSEVGRGTVVTIKKWNRDA